MTSTDRQHVQTVSSVTPYSDSELLAAIQTVGAVVRTPKHRFEADKFPMFSGGWTWQGFVAIWIPVGLSSGLSPRCDPFTSVPLGDYERECHLLGL